MQCVESVGGNLRLVNPQPSDLSACQMVIGSYSEMSSELTRLSPAEGAQIAGAILLIWAMGWAVRVAVRSLNVGEKEEL